MPKRGKTKKVNLWAGGIGTAHFLRSGAGVHTPRKFTKDDRRAGKRATKEDSWQA
jgi:hypothetical protein